MTRCCDVCPHVPECIEDEMFNCHIDLHDWSDRGDPDDQWRECHLCGAIEEPSDDLDYADCTCGHYYGDHDAAGCFPACGCSVSGPARIEDVLDGTGATANTWQSAARRLADENRHVRRAIAALADEYHAAAVPPVTPSDACLLGVSLRLRDLLDGGAA